MKKIVFSLFSLSSFCAFAQDAKPDVISPEVLSDKQVVFRIYAPKAESVKLSSDDKWDKIDFKKDSRGVWEGVWDNVQPGAYRYRFVVDGVNVYDPAAPTARETTALLTMTSGDDFFAMKDDVAHGAISQRHYYSKTVKQTRRLHVWTPPGAELSKEALPVFYLIHGGGDKDNAWSTIGCAANILDNLFAEGKIVPMIVVMPNGSVESETETMLEKVPIFKDDLINDIIPFIESNYNVYKDAEHRAIMGLSFGGLETLEAVTAHPEAFDYVGVLSSGWWISDTWFKKRGTRDDISLRIKRLKETASTFNESVKILYFTQGGPEDLAYENGMETLKLFDAAGIKYKYSESPGGHTWMVWRKNLWDLAPLLFK
ncbi:alpha/beta hydrolase-fold protein [Arcticibacterium luteifluviistationis]|uniref:Endo-1,4-beta-xylanase Z n=1 Tax=Arcticibacterium luteifluviistationis TaxID=1784714 RepID=A0A2Z4G7H9_9BACT|nr:alpha/beta hydrolase-fold protein [Arcticibacterium luteifluviistationis]AWV97131.1 endo-1,4-beta-xylanase Z [Arcticibacterium luteifluviistationis]